MSKRTRPAWLEWRVITTALAATLIGEIVTAAVCWVAEHIRWVW